MTITPKVLGGDFELANALESRAATMSQSVYEASRRLLDEIDGFPRKPHYAGLLATHLVTATLFTGQGQVGAGNDRAACDFQLAQRPDFFEEFVGWQTTHRRPILNLRDEAHAGKALARMHVIFFDNTLA